MMRGIAAWTIAGAFAFVASLGAQEVKVKSKTDIDVDDGKVVLLSGCLRPGFDAGTYLLSNATLLKGEELESETETKVDIDEDETEVEKKTKIEVEGEDKDKPVGTAGLAVVYELTPNEGVNLAPHLGHKVEITAVALEPGKGDAEVEMKSETKVKVEDAPDAKVKSKIEADLPRGANPRLVVMSVKHIEASCTP